MYTAVLILWAVSTNKMSCSWFPFNTQISLKIQRSEAKKRLVFIGPPFSLRLEDGANTL